MDGLFDVLHVPTLGDISVHFQNGWGLVSFIADEHLTTFNDHRAPIPAGMS
jgi:hypothetical protein